MDELPIVDFLLDLSEDIRVAKSQDERLKQAAALIRAQHEALVAAKEWLDGWASAEPYPSTITAALAKAKEV